MLAVAGAGCGPGQPTTAATAPASAVLVVLAGEPGSASLVVRGERVPSRTLSLPAPETAWISAGASGQLVATLEGGELRISGPITSAAEPAWAPVATPDPGQLPDPLLFASWSPDGRRLAAIATDFGVESRLTVVIVDPVAGTSRLLPVPRRPVIAPPTWLDAQRILIQTTAGLVIVEAGTGTLAAGPPVEIGPGLSLSPAANGSLIAISAPEGGAVELRDLRGWLAGDRAEPVARIEGLGEVGAVALDATGERLAVVWQQLEGPGTLIVYHRADGWREADRLTLPGESSRAAIDWLRAAPVGTGLRGTGRSGGLGGLGGEDGDLRLLGQHGTHDLLQGQEMDARGPALEVMAGAVPLTGVETDVVGVVVAPEGEREPIDRDPVQLAGVTICLLDLADQGAVHRAATSVAPWGAAGAAVRSMHLDR